MKYQKLLKSLLRTAKNKFDQRHLEKADTKKVWKYVNEKLDRKTKNQQINQILINLRMSNNNYEKANCFNEFYSTIVNKLNGNVVEPIVPHEIPDIKFNSHSLFLTPASENEVHQTIYELKNKAGGSDGLHAFIIKLAAPYITAPLTQIINKAMVNGTCPIQFKTADICPVHKSGSKTLVDNYRPISLIYQTWLKFLKR